MKGTRTGQEAQRSEGQKEKRATDFGRPPSPCRKGRPGVQGLSRARGRPGEAGRGHGGEAGCSLLGRQEEGGLGLVGSHSVGNSLARAGCEKRPRRGDGAAGRSCTCRDLARPPGACWPPGIQALAQPHTGQKVGACLGRDRRWLEVRVGTQASGSRAGPRPLLP